MCHFILLFFSQADFTRTSRYLLAFSKSHPSQIHTPLNTRLYINQALWLSSSTLLTIIRHYTPLAPSADDAVLLARLRAQVDFYFSPQNLAKDTFLSSLLEQHDNAVPLETIASFPKVRQLHAIGRLGMSGMPQSQMPPADPTFLAKALEESRVVTVSNNGQWIHLAKSEGTTTATTTLEDVSPSPPSTLEGGTHAAATSRLRPLLPRLLRRQEYRLIRCLLQIRNNRHYCFKALHKRRHCKTS